MSLCKRHATYLLSLWSAACSTTGTIDLTAVQEESLACVAPVIDDLEAYDSHVTLRTHEEAVALFREIVEKGNSEELRTAWALAAHCPSPEMAKIASKRLARFSVWHPTDQLFVEVADAIVANNLIEAYPLLRPTFMKSGTVPFAKALATLDPETASDDFVTYLAVVESGLAPEDAVDYVLEHLALYLPNPRHPMLAILLQLASRPEGERARLVAAQLLEEHPTEFSFNLQRIDDATRTALCTRAVGLCALGG